MEQIRLLSLILLIGIVSSGIVILIARFEKNRCFLKYIPALILFVSGAFFIVKARWFSEGMEGLGYIILAMLALGGFIITLISAVIIDIYRKCSKKRKAL